MGLFSSCWLRRLWTSSQRIWTTRSKLDKGPSCSGSFHDTYITVWMVESLGYTNTPAWLYINLSTSSHSIFFLPRNDKGKRQQTQMKMITSREFASYKIPFKCEHLHARKIEGKILLFHHSKKITSLICWCMPMQSFFPTHYTYIYIFFMKIV